MQVKTTVHIHFQKYSFDEEGEFQVFSFKFDDSDHRVYVGSQEIEIEVPDDYDPRAQQIAALEKQRTKVMADYQNMVTEINARISKLQALEHTA